MFFALMGLIFQRRRKTTYYLVQQEVQRSWFQVGWFGGSMTSSKIQILPVCSLCLLRVWALASTLFLHRHKMAAGVRLHTTAPKAILDTSTSQTLLKREKFSLTFQGFLIGQNCVDTFEPLGLRGCCGVNKNNLAQKPETLIWNSSSEVSLPCDLQ